MKVEQYVMAYGVEQDRLRALLPDGFSSLRPVLRINAEIRDDRQGYVEFNTAVEHSGLRGWLNIARWADVLFTRTGKTVTFQTEFLTLSFTGAGVEGGCPAERDNAGCFVLEQGEQLIPPEPVSANKEFCDCQFQWHFSDGDAHGVSLGKTLPAIPTQPRTAYPRAAFTPENAAKIPCDQVLGTYVVIFERV